MKRTNKTLTDLITFAYFIGATNGHSDDRLFEALPKYDGRFKINPVIKMTVKNQVRGIIPSDTPYYEATKGRIHMPPKTHFPSASEYHLVLLHELGHAMSNTDDALQLSIANIDYQREHGVIGDTNKLLNTLVSNGYTQAAFESFSKSERNLLVAYMKEELQVNMVAGALLLDAGYKHTKLITADISGTASLAHTISGFVGQDFTKEIYTESSKYAHETKALFNAISKEIEKAEKELGKLAKDFAPKEKTKDHSKEK